MVEDLLYLLSEDDINSSRYYGTPPIHFAVATGNMHIISQFIMKGARVDAKDLLAAHPLSGLLSVDILTLQGT